MVPIEVGLVFALREALQLAESVKGERPSRENSLAVTHLEDALFRAERDVQEKGMDLPEPEPEGA